LTVVIFDRAMKGFQVAAVDARLAAPAADLDALLVGHPAEPDWRHREPPGGLTDGDPIAWIAV
jgi:hypothetical protein